MITVARGTLDATFSHPFWTWLYSSFENMWGQIDTASYSDAQSRLKREGRAMASFSYGDPNLHIGVFPSNLVISTTRTSDKYDM